MQDARFKGLDKFTNAAFVLSAFSAATSDVYISSRYLFFLAQHGHAPRFCSGTFKTGSGRTVVPWVGIAVSSAFALLAFMSASSAIEVRD
jgi:amino acid transporter